MSTGSHGLKVIASLAVLALTYAALASCGGGSSRPATGGGTSDQIIIEPRPPRERRPDLEVTSPSVSTGSPTAGAPFTLSATVHNAGDGESPATMLRYYRSTDAIITIEDTEVGILAMSPLAASGSGSQSVDLIAPSAPGLYHYGACVDAVTGESDTTNNCSTAVKVAVPDRQPQSQRRPDLVVGRPTVTDTSPRAGAPFTLSATVSNAGDGESATTTLRYYRSTDATITISDTPLGTAAVTGLAPSGSASQSVDLSAPSTPGTYYHGACVDAVTDEPDTADNCSAPVKVVVRVPKYPDLEVGTPTVTDTSPRAGAPFTLSATVSNAGDGESATTTLRYYRSTDATITASDTQVGTDAVGALSASGSGSQSVDLTAPEAPGTYYYGACVDAVARESDRANNCSTAVEVTVRESRLRPQGRPDLAVGTPTVTDTSPRTGAPFTLSASVGNAGDGESAATTLRYYQSTDATITTADAEVGTDAVGALSSSGSGSQSMDLTAPATSGTYYYGACVDTVADESDTENNCSASVKVDVEAPKYPDLEVVGTPTVSDASPETGAGFTLSATVSNAGDAESPATTLRYYRSTDATITTSDTAVGTDAVGVLSASGTSEESVSLTAPETAGTYYYGACVDTVADESDTENNCSASVKVDVEAPKYPDLEVVGTPTVSDASPETGAGFTLSATVSNAGDAESPATTLRYYQSTDATITTTDTAVGTDAVGVLSASGTSAESVSLTAPAAAGTYYYGACVDAVTDESDTANNCSASVKVDVEAPKYPDLQVGTPTVDDSNPAPEASFTLSATVSNAGDGESAATTLRYYQSTDATIETTDTAVGTDEVGMLAASGSDSQSVDLTAPSTPGTYYYGACVDAVSDESDTNNNCSTAVTVTVPEFQQQQENHPDLEVGAPTVDDATPRTEASFTLSATVSNAGDGESPSTTLRYYQSTDATITTADTEVGTDTVDVLSAEGTSAQSISLTAPSTTGAYYYGACVDAVTDESDTTNNCSTSVKVDVEEATYPDLKVGTPTVSDTSPETGATFSLFATVSNTGDGESAATTLRYYQSEDATITTADTEVGTDTVEALSASGTDAESMSPTAPSEVGTYYYGACVDAVADESHTTNNCSTSVKVDVEEPKPNLTVGRTEVDWTDPVTGETFTLSVTVWNLSRVATAATTLRYYRSTDATITTSDTEVGTDAVGALSAYGGSEESISVTAPSTVGPYYYGACVDAVTDESNTTDNCSQSVKVDVVAPGRRVDISPRKLTFEAVGDSETVTVRILDENGDEDPDASFAWIGASPVGGWCCTFETVDGDLKVTMNKAGRVTLSISSDDAMSATLKVTAYQTPASLEVSPDSVSLEVDGTSTLSATVKDANGNAIDGRNIYWTTSDSEVATVEGEDEGGETGATATVTAVAAGTATITGRTAGTNVRGTATVTVTVAEFQQQRESHPDLEVGTPTVDDANPVPGGTLTLSATVSNTGGGEAAATTLRYYRSTDATITTSDTELGTDDVTALAAEGTSEQSIPLTAPTRVGTYYYGACVDTVTDESDTADNCSSSVQVTVKAADLEVGTPTVDDANPEPEATFTLSATVSNIGVGKAPATTLRYYQSRNATISPTDTEVGTDEVPELAAAGTSAQSISVTAPTRGGTYHYGACVDTVTSEPNTTNNCSSSVQVTVPGPDLQVTTPTVDDANPEPGGVFMLTATVSNTGDAESEATTLRAYRPATTNTLTSDTEVGSVAVGALAASATTTVSISLTAPAVSGPYNYGVCVDAPAHEAVTTDNCSATVRVEAEEKAQPDGPTVEVTHERTNWPVPAGNTLTFTARVLNAEGEEIEDEDVSIEWSSNNTAVATVDAAGEVTAVAAGAARVTATATLSDKTTVSGSHAISVIKRAAKVVVTPDSLSFTEVGATATVTATVYDADGNTFRPTTTAWGSSDGEVAKVRSLRFGGPLAMQVEAIGEGTATVSMTANYGATGSVSVTVALPEARVEVSPGTLRFDTLGSSKTATVTVYDEDGNEDEDATITWTSSFKSGTGTSIGDGGLDIEAADDGIKVTANEVGRAQVTINSGDVEPAILTVYVGQKPVSLTVSPASASLAVDATAELSASMVDGNGHPVQINDGKPGQWR